MHAADARQLATQLMRQHLDDSWTFRWSTARNTLGACNYDRRRISLSRPFAEHNDEPAVRDIILHEIAHALTPPEVYGNRPHGHEWRVAAMKLGATPTTCQDPRNIVVPPGRYEGRCPIDGCTTVTQRQRMTARAHNFICRTHGESIVWTRNH